MLGQALWDSSCLDASLMEAIIFKCMCVFTMHFLMVVDKNVSGACVFYA